MSGLIIVSTDCHAGLPTDGYREYLESEHHGVLDDYLASREQARAVGATLGSGRKGFAIFSQQFVDDFNAEDLVEPGGPAGAWDFERRTKELEADGVAAEVIYPGPVNLNIETSIPFQGRAFFGDAFTADHSLPLMWAGARAYNRFLSERLDPLRQAGLALIPSLADMDEVLAELRWAATNQFRGIIVRQAEEGLPLLADLRYEPLWAAAAEAGLVVHFHGGVGQPLELPINSPAAGMFAGIETAFWGYRPVWYLIFGGVFERHPKLRVVFTEVHASWVPSVIDMLDVRYQDQWLMFSEHLPRKPSEYWYQNCSIGASFVSRAEVEMIDYIGPKALMYGSDYPHVEGIWPQTIHYMHEVFAGIDPQVTQNVAGLNAVDLYRFDRSQLQQVADRIAPTVDEVVSGAPSLPSTHARDRIAARAARPASWVIGGVPRGFELTPRS